MDVGLLRGGEPLKTRQRCPHQPLTQTHVANRQKENCPQTIPRVEREARVKVASEGYGGQNRWAEWHVGPTIVHVRAEIIAGVGGEGLRRLAGAAAQRVVAISCEIERQTRRARQGYGGQICREWKELLRGDEG